MDYIPGGESKQKYDQLALHDKTICLSRPNLTMSASRLFANATVAYLLSI